LADLRREAGSPPSTTMRTHLRRLERLGIVERREQSAFPGNVEFELGTAGEGMLVVSGALEGWLAGAPDGEVALGTVASKSAIGALVHGWSTSMIRALAARPLTLTELSRVISTVSYPSLERRLAAMRLAGQVERRAGSGRGAPYGPTDWLRQAVAPLAAAARWERRHLAPNRAPVAPRDVEAVFLLTLAELRLDQEHSGACRLVVEFADGSERRLAGVLAGVEKGKVAFCSTRLEGRPSASVAGSTGAWLDALLERDGDLLEFSGDVELGRALFEAFRSYLTPIHVMRGSAHAEPSSGSSMLGR
jgi:DNA-binding HxlR family transcriptional regulator